MHKCNKKKQNLTSACNLLDVFYEKYKTLFNLLSEMEMKLNEQQLNELQLNYAIDLELEY